MTSEVVKSAHTKLDQDSKPKSNLYVWALQPEFMLAMKCISARFDSSDLDDIQTLIHHLGLSSPKKVFAIIEQFYPKNRIPLKAQFAIAPLILLMGIV